MHEHCSADCGHKSVGIALSKTKSLKEHIYTCPICKITITGKNQILRHKQEDFEKLGYYVCPYCFEHFSSHGFYGGHIVSCKQNPDYEKILEKKKIAGHFANLGHKMSDEQKLILSQYAKQQGLGGYVYKKDGRRGVSRIAKAGMYKGIWCDSSWELAFIVYNIEHNIKFEKCNESFEYFSSYDNKKHKYHPDFKYDKSTYIEIKGWMNNSSLIKINEFRKNHPNLKLEIIDEAKIKPYLSYVKEKYGERFYEQLYE